MPFDIKPIGGSSGGSSYDVGMGGDWGWLGSQEFHYNRTFAATGNRTRGKIGGGPTATQLLADLDPQQHTILADPPAVNTPILSGTRLSAHATAGSFNFDLIDPFGTLTQATGSAAGLNDPLVGNESSHFDPGAFLAAKNIDLFGQGSSGVPARLADYALALPTVLLNKAAGVQSAEPSANAGVQYRFQADPGYWSLLRSAGQDETKLRELATSIANRYVDPGHNAYAVQQLLDTFKKDRDQMEGLTSGNDRTDYIAKWRFASDLAAAQAAPDTAAGNGFSERNLRSSAIGIDTVSAELVSAIPFVGPQIASGIAPINAVDGEWARLTPDQRRAYLGDAGVANMALDIAVTLPLLSGLGSAAAWAKNAGGIAGTVYKGYDATVRGASLVMGAGLVTAVTNWGLEAAWPDYSKTLGAEIDRARPVSSSSLAGVVNQLGFWASGSFGVGPAAQITSKALSKVIGGAERLVGPLRIPHPTIGSPELSFFRDGYGGSMVRDELKGTGLSANGIETSVKASFLSHVLNWAEKDRRAGWEAALRGEDTPWADINALPLDGRQAAAQEALARSLHDGPTIAESVIRLLGYARQERPLGLSGDAEEAWLAARRVGKAADESLAADVVATYGPEWMMRRTGRAYTVKDLDAWARAKVTELGGDGTKLGKHDTEGWAKIVRTLHQFEYHSVNGEVAAALEKEASQEADRIAVIAGDHLFGGMADNAMKAIDAGATSSIVSLIRNTREGAEWFANWHPKDGIAKTPENVPPSLFRQWLEDARPALPNRRENAALGSPTADHPLNALQREMDRAGTWTLAFKPVDAEGNLVSYARTRGGAGVLRSPWVEYPMSSLDNIALGNRGWMTSKMDSLFRGFRTRRLVEYQKGSLYRILSTKIEGVLPEQIEVFHDKIMSIARQARIQPQTAGALTRLHEAPFAHQTAEQLNRAAEEAFGPAAKKVDWGNVVAKAYRQSFKLNLTAGLTSQLKSMGPVGAGIAYASDMIYPVWRFGLSPLFKGGELLESAILNALRGSFRRDPAEEALFIRGGIGNDAGLFNSEMAFDQMIQSTTGIAPSASQRLAAALSFHARRAPEDFAFQREKASLDEAAAAAPFRPTFRQADGLDMARLMQEWEWSPARAQSLVENSEMIPIELLRPLVEVDRRARPELSMHGTLEDLAADLGAEGQKTPVIVWWDPATNHAVLADGNHRFAVADEGGWTEMAGVIEARSTAEVGQAEQLHTITNIQSDIAVPSDGIIKPSAFFAEGKRPLDLPPLAADEDGLIRDLKATFATEPRDVFREQTALQAELDSIVGENGVTLGLELRAKEILDRLDEIERAKGDGGPVLRLEDLSAKQQAEWRSRLFDSGDLRPPSADPLGGRPTTAARLSALKPPLEEGYLYHGTTRSTLAAIADQGVVPRNDGTSWWSGFKMKLGSGDVGDGFEVMVRTREERLGSFDWGWDRVDKVARVTADVPASRLEFWGADGAWHPMAELDPAALEARAPKWEPTPAELQSAFERFQRRPGNTDDMADVAGTPEALEAAIIAAAEAAPKGSAAALALDTFWHPTRYKQGKALTLQIQLMKTQFPGLLKASGNTGLMEVLHSLHVPENKWATWLLEDRKLLDGWLNNHDQASLDALLKHAGDDAATRATFNDLYSSEEWSTISALWSLNLKSAQDEAFGVHFFSPYRSAFERSINHPVLGIYPASWAIKAAREWAKFLYDNRTFGELHLGMAPAQALATTVRGQSATFAMNNDDTLSHFFQKGPLGSTVFIFNLLMPGDWSSLPFSLSRTIRELVKGDTDPGKIMQANIDYLGTTRDARLIYESAGELGSLISGHPKAYGPGSGNYVSTAPMDAKAQAAAEQKAALKGLRDYSARGVESQWAAEPRR